VLALAVFVSGRGSNLRAVLDSPALKNLIQVKAVVGDKLYCPAFDIVKIFSIPVYSIGKKEGFISFDDLEIILKDFKIDLIVLAGFLKLIPDNFVRAFRNKIINIHPALLPNYGGKGMYGSKVHEAVIANKEKESGITIHYVDEQYDHGDIIFQAHVPVETSDSPQTLAQKIHRLEHAFYPKIVEETVLKKMN